MNLFSKIANAVLPSHEPAQSTGVPWAYSILADSSNFALLTASPNVSAIVFLNTCIDSYHAHGINRVHYPKGFILSKLPAEQYPEWTWNPHTQMLQPTLPDLITDQIRHASALATARRDAFIHITNSLNTARQKVRTGLEFQETVYMTKKMQAREFMTLGYPEDRILEFPYVLQYSEYAKISSKQAADDILFKAKLDDEYLAKTELLRMKYSNIIRDTTDPSAFEGIRTEFTREIFVNARV